MPTRVGTSANRQSQQHVSAAQTFLQDTICIMLFMGDGKLIPISSIIVLGFMPQLMKLILLYRRPSAPESIVAALFMAMKPEFLMDLLHAEAIGAVKWHCETIPELWRVDIVLFHGSTHFKSWQEYHGLALLSWPILASYVLKKSNFIWCNITLQLCIIIW